MLMLKSECSTGSFLSLVKVLVVFIFIYYLITIGKDPEKNSGANQEIRFFWERREGIVYEGARI